MARRYRSPRSIPVSTTVTIDEKDYEVSGSYTRGSSDYFDKSWGNWLPGDPDELEDIEVTLDGAPVDYDALPEDTRKFIDQQLVLAAEEDARDAEADEGDRRYDAWKDEQFERGIRDDYFGGGK
jgi:hypothetical protein